MIGERYVIIVAGGKGTRVGADKPKQFLPIAGKMILQHTLEAFYQWDPSARLVLVLPEAYIELWKRLLDEYGCRIPHQLVKGGETRFHSVREGLRSIPQEAKALVAIHDGVRPFVGKALIDSCFEEAARSGAAVPVVPLVDTIREQMDGSRSRTADRGRFLAVQTPQVFDLDLLRRAYEQPYSGKFTDDASVVEALGVQVAQVSGSRQNIKITTPVDLLIARALLEER